jgi:hypothetical protein
MSQALIGIDWGTHSSKWNWMSGGDDYFERGEFKIFRSDVCLDPSDRIYLNTDPPREDSVFEAGIKGTLIRDPNGAFWEGRRQIKLTLGELVCFSLWSLLSDAYHNLCEKSQTQPDKIDVRFSLPNWVGLPGAAVARAKYEQAGRVACYMFVQDRDRWLHIPKPLRSEWRAAVARALSDLNLSDDSERSNKDFREAIQSEFEVDKCISFRFVAESSAAGLTGLQESEGASSPQLTKILVVDVGAGSTDIGYVLRTIPSGTQRLVQLPPANTCEIAGEALTRCIVEIYRGKGEKITFREAELRKLVQSDRDWLSHNSVTEWKRGIAEHVRTYVAGVADERWLPEKPPLHILVTGGSGTVAGLQAEILLAAKKGLEQRNIHPNLINGTTLMTLDTDGPWATDVNRLAVALGAASEELPKLSYQPNLGPAVSEVPVRAEQGWTRW